MDTTNKENRRSKEKMSCVPHITSFCWCMGLEMGTKLIGFIHLGISVTLMIICSIMAESARSYRDTVEDSDGLYTTWYKVTVTVACVTILHILLALLLLYSAYKRLARGLRVWVAVSCLLYAAAVLYVLVQLAVTGASGTGSEIFLSFLEGVVTFGVMLYCIVCVNSYYLMLKSCEDMEGPKTYY